MKRKNIIIIFAVIIILIAIISGLFALGFFNKTKTSSFDNNFMKGKFIGNVSEVPIPNSTIKDWYVSYNDDVNKISYNVSTCKNASFLKDYLDLQGYKGPETRNYSGQEWNIYSAQGVPNTNNTTNSTNNVTQKIVYNNYICQADKNGQSYLIFIIYTSDGTSSAIKADGSVYCELFTEYIEPLLSSITLKHNDNAPEVYDLLGITKQDYDGLIYGLELYKNGTIDSNGNLISS